MRKSLLVIVFISFLFIVPFCQTANLREVPAISWSPSCYEVDSGYYFQKVRPGARLLHEDQRIMRKSNVDGYYYTDKDFNVIKYLVNDLKKDFYDTRLLEFNGKMYFLTLNVDLKANRLDFIYRPIEQSSEVTVYHSENFKMDKTDFLADEVNYIVSKDGKHLFVMWQNVRSLPDTYQVFEFGSDFKKIASYAIEPGFKQIAKNSDIQTSIDSANNILLISRQGKTLYIVNFSTATKKQSVKTITAPENMFLSGSDIDENAGLIYAVAANNNAISRKDTVAEIGELYIYNLRNEKLTERKIYAQKSDIDSLSYPGNLQKAPTGTFSISYARIFKLNNGNCAITFFTEEEITFTDVSSHTNYYSNTTSVTKTSSSDMTLSGTNNIWLRVYDKDGNKVKSQSLYRERINAGLWGKMDYFQLKHSVVIFCGTKGITRAIEHKKLSFYEIKDDGTVEYRYIYTYDGFQYFEGKFEENRIPIINRG